MLDSAASAVYGSMRSPGSNTNYNIYNTNRSMDYNSKIDTIIAALVEIAKYTSSTSNGIDNLKGLGGTTNIAVQNPNGGVANKTLIRDPLDVVKQTSRTGIPELIAKGGIT